MINHFAFKEKRYSWIFPAQELKSTGLIMAELVFVSINIIIAELSLISMQVMHAFAEIRVGTFSFPEYLSYFVLKLY